MAMITLRLREGDKEAEITLESKGSVNCDAAKAILYEIMEKKPPVKEGCSVTGE